MFTVLGGCRFDLAIIAGNRSVLALSFVDAGRVAKLRCDVRRGCCFVWTVIPSHKCGQYTYRRANSNLINLQKVVQTVFPRQCRLVFAVIFNFSPDYSFVSQLLQHRLRSQCETRLVSL